MIVPMKKAAIITQVKDADSAVKRLSEIGVLHVEHQRPPQSADINALRDDVALVSGAITILSNPEFAPKERFENITCGKEWKTVAAHVVELQTRLDHLEEYSRSLNKTLKDWERWGDFNPESIKELALKGIYARLYEIPVKEMKKIPGEVVARKIFTAGGTAGYVLISRSKINTPFKEIEPPKMSLEAMRSRIKEDLRTIQSIKDDLIKHLCYKNAFNRIKMVLEKDLELHEALKGMGEARGIAYLVGYVPHDMTKRLDETAQKEAWGLIILEPSGEDNVPTLIRNPRWISLIEPVFKVIEIVPGYRELDVSLWFLVFFSIFFGMLIGDAGIGVVFIALTFFGQLKFGKSVRDKSVFVLFYILSSCAVLWGALTGTFFGQEWLPPSVKPLIPALREDKNVQVFCFFLGALHLSMAHVWRAALKLPALTALADIGWALMLWGAFFLARLLVLGDAFPAFAKWLFIAGPVLVVLFTDPSRGILRGLPGGLGNLLLNVVNSLTDVVSYVRLFAVGLATVAVADSFNKIALDIGFNSFASGVATSLIILVGQALNIMLGPLSVLVHGVRLNVLEFCNHVDIKWSGFLYKPLRKEAAKYQN